MPTFTYTGAFNDALYPDLLNDPQLFKEIKTKALYQFASIGRTRATRVTTRFNRNGEQYVVNAIRA